jgi:carbamoyltransferase
MRILAIHDGHNASACLMQDGIFTHAVQEERLTGVKNQAGFPERSIRWVLKDAGLKPKDLDAVVFGSLNRTTPHTRDTLVASYRAQDLHPPTLQFQWRLYRSALLKRLHLYEWAKKAVHDDRFEGVYRLFPSLDREKVSALDHHLCHATTAYYTSPWGGEEALVLTLDGEGDGLCATVNVARDGRLVRVAATPAGHSLGNIYSRTTLFMGFVPLEHEYKLMGLAPYADEERAEEVSRILEAYLQVDGLVFRRRVPEPTPFIGKRLAHDLRYIQFHWLAGGLQRFTEKLVLQWVRNAIAKTGVHRVCLAGGVFMNIKANGLLALSEEVESIFVPPSCGDETLPFGAASLTFAAKHDFTKLATPLTHVYLGPDFEEKEIYDRVCSLPNVTLEECGNIPARAAQLISRGDIVARCNGRTEFGARALGNRSIFADPAGPLVARELNQMIKMRDFWMPFAPIVLSDKQDRYLVNPKGIPSPFMMFGFPSVPEQYENIAAAVQPADRSARPQILDRGLNPEVEAMLDEFERITGRAMLINTSYNIHGEPIVATVEQALDVFHRSGLRWLWLGPLLLHKVRPLN